MATSAVRNRNRCSENLFFPGMAVLILATVFVGFAHTYYRAGVFHAPLPNLIVHIHGAVFSFWVLLPRGCRISPVLFTERQNNWRPWALAIDCGRRTAHPEALRYRVPRAGPFPETDPPQ
jgi:hypothetical protein